MDKNLDEWGSLISWANGLSDYEKRHKVVDFVQKMRHLDDNSSLEVSVPFLSALVGSIMQVNDYKNSS